MSVCSRLKALLVASLLLLPAGALAGELEAGLAAYRAKDYAQAFVLLAPLAENNEREAQFVLGEMYRKGQGLVQSIDDALPLLRKAAEAGHVGAQLALAQIYESGAGVETDHDAALQWLTRAAESGDAQAQLNIGLHYIRIEAHRDFDQAAKWIRLAAEQNDAEAQYFYARLLLDGRGVEANVDEATQWFERAARQGHVPAQRFLPVLALPENPDKGLELRELRRHLAAGIGSLEGVAPDAGYGFDRAKPVRAGQDYMAQWRYLNALRGPKGELVHYRSLGICCYFIATDAPSGKGYLDRYELTYDGLAKPAILYFNLFAADALLLAPAGFSFVRAAE
jgi:TPR repeat protein